jgi:hypothetical protein
METRLLNKVLREIYRRFPQVRDCQPRIQAYRGGKNSSFARLPAYLLIFQSQATTVTGKISPFYLRVVVDEQGKILKVSTSR